MKLLKIYTFLLAMFSILGCNDLFAQTMMPLPAPTYNYGPYNGHIRGYWFEAPTNFTITGLRVPVEAGTGLQTLYVIVINDPVPVVWPTTSTNFTQLYGVTGVPNMVIQNVNIPITTGQKVAILGHAGGIHTYGATAAPSNIDGLPVTLYRMGSQNLFTPGTPLPDYWTEPANIARVEMYYNACTAYDTIRPVICDNQVFRINNKEYTASGTYIDSFKVGSCDSIVTTILTVNPTYEQTIVDSFYQGGTYHFNGIDYTSAGTYRLNYPSVYGCDSVTYLALKEIPFRVYNVDTIMCQGYFFTFQGKKYDRTGIYSDTFVAPGYHKVLNLDLTIRPNPNLKMTIKDKDPNELCAGEPITLLASGAESYEWLRRRSPVDERLYTEAEFKTFVYGPETPMALIGKDDIGCYTRIEFDLLGKNCCDLAVPTAFSPNGDGLNDGFSVLGRQPARYIINIYNRTGNLVFTSEKVDAVWDGTFKGREAPQDTYFYIIQGECFDGSVINKKGDITLIR